MMPPVETLILRRPILIWLNPTVYVSLSIIAVDLSFVHVVAPHDSLSHGEGIRECSSKEKKKYFYHEVIY